ncbi:hypothetical protein COY17_00120 [Candidatus Saccharibacteria bacterium CG_4_10_14_0_2_um_filter_52_9]|nr:MAG: hypothetical protein COY17_00120 [Candidatus Saccharibacteria bacterium CG_4_10_14_0_2_um_filter_52_9]
MPKKSSKPAGSRRLKQPEYQTLRLQKRVKHPVRLSNVYRLTKTAALTLWAHKGLFAGITLVYGLLNLLLVRGLSAGGDVASLKQTLDQAFTGNFGSVVSGLSVFSVLIGSAGNTTDGTAGAYQLFLALISSLAMIWALRQVLVGVKLRVREAYYRGMYPLVPFVLVLLVVSLQLLPLIIGSALYSQVVSSGIAVYFIEKFLWALLYGLLALLTFYMLSSSLFALYIVTLPDMTPVKALRSARELVRYRRWTVLRKILALPIILLLAAGVVMVPIIIWLTPLAQWTFFVLTMSALLAVHAYMYSLYRELLND